MPIGLPHQEGLLGKGGYSPESIARPASQRLNCRVRQANGTSCGGSQNSKAVPVELNPNQAAARKSLLDTGCESLAF